MALKVFILVISILFVACSEELSKRAEEAKALESLPPKVTIQSSALAEAVKVVITGADPEKYTVQFSWPHLEKDKILRIRLGTVLQEILSSQTFFTHTVGHNQILNYSFDILDSNRKPEMTFRKTVIIPYDFVVREGTGVLLYNTKIEANRVFLSDKIPLTTNGTTLDIAANELHAANGSIQTFPESIKIKNSQGFEEELPPTAPDGVNGRSGGAISISAKKLYGRLHVYMRGEKGGRGLKGDPKPQASAGVPAESAKPECLKDSPVRFSLSQCSCPSDLRPGGQGADGEKGNPGRQGMSGGDSGSVRIMIQEYIPSEGIDSILPTDGVGIVDVVQLPGVGGDGGFGGDGQAGGAGGPGRNIAGRLECRGDGGMSGKDGPVGDAGGAGHPGVLGMKCVYIGSENQNDCSQGDGR
ncbi:collagen-like domain-containing protein [Bdellovibrio svalbardensis]|uniref:Collagen-like protein n=1 Tax=Bdellovibrio svalbardensis TaxID=2972972 RepID=A0ABT6DMV8_9BACT|nr:hypothetical protein [Bdellovibrio svalbardensis]MDG0816468.1 hypothetical protein [Bdellovibrio svalbardensis]